MDELSEETFDLLGDNHDDVRLLANRVRLFYEALRPGAEPMSMSAAVHLAGQWLCQVMAETFWIDDDDEDEDDGPGSD